VKAEEIPTALTDIWTATDAKCASASLTKLFEAYVAEQRIKPNTANEWRVIIRKLVAFVGHDDAKRLQVLDIDRWRDHLLVERHGEKLAREPGTVRDKYLSAVRATLNWAVEKRYLTKNVVTGVVVRVPRKALLRQRDLTEEEVRAILSGSLKPYPKLRLESGLARRWIPWICAYTGARVNEISQLRKEDVFSQDGIDVIRITPEAGTVKSDAARLVPLHPHLIEQGLLAVLNQRPLGPVFYNPEHAKKPSPSNRYIKKVAERLCAWIRDDLGIVDPNVQPNHGWRHRFKSIMLDLGVPERIGDTLQGHAPRSVGQTYGNVPLKALKRAIDAIPMISLEDT